MTYTFWGNGTILKFDPLLMERLLEEVRVARHELFGAADEEHRTIAENHLLNATQILSDVLNR